MSEVVKRECQAVNDFGKKCRCKAVKAIDYCGNREAYHHRRGWRVPRHVKVYFCKMHLKAINDMKTVRRKV